MKRIYLSPSNQEHNVGVGGYGTEEVRMHELAVKRIMPLLKLRGFAVRVSEPTWSMAQVCRDSNDWNADLHVCLHTNAGGGDGAVAFYGSARGKAAASAIYDRLALLTPAKDEGVRSWPGLYEVRNTKAPCAYLELFFHDNLRDVTHYLAHEGEYAEAVARGICDFFEVPWQIEKVDYRPLKREALKVAELLDLDTTGIVLTAEKGEPFERLLRAIAAK